MKLTLTILVSILTGFFISTLMYAHLYWDSNNENLMWYDYTKSRHGKYEANKIREYVKYHSTDKFLKSGIKERVR